MKKKTQVVLLLLAAVALIVLPDILTNNYYIIVCNQTLISIIVLMGLNFVTGLMGQMNLGTAGIMALGAYTSALFCTKLNMSPWIAMVFVVLMGCILGVALGYPSLRIKGIYLSLTTLGFSEIIRILLNNLVNLTGGPTGVRSIPKFSFFGILLKSSKQYYYLLLVFVVILMVIALAIINSKWGRAIKAIKDSDLAVEACGIKLSTVKVFAFTLCCVYGCIGGALHAHLIGYISPSDFTMDTTIKYLMMLMVGGIGSIGGNVLGAIIVNVLPEVLRFMDDYYWLVFSSIILVCSIVKPNGLMPELRKLFSAIARKLVKPAGKGVKEHG